MKIMSVNAGSSSLKFSLFDMKDEQLIASGYFERSEESGNYSGYREVGTSFHQLHPFDSSALCQWGFGGGAFQSDGCS